MSNNIASALSILFEHGLESAADRLAKIAETCDCADCLEYRAEGETDDRLWALELRAERDFDD